MPIVLLARKKQVFTKSFAAVDLTTSLNCKNLIDQKESIKQKLREGSYSNMLKLKLKMGLIYFATGQYINSIQLFKEAISYNPELVFYLLGLSSYYKAKLLENSGRVCFSTKYYERSIYYYKKALKENTRSIFNKIICFNLCLIFMKNGSLFELKTHTNKYLNKDNKNIQASLIRKEKAFCDLEDIINSDLESLTPCII